MSRRLRRGALLVAGLVVAGSWLGCSPTPPSSVPSPVYAVSGKVTDAFIGPTLGIAGVSVGVAGGPSNGSATTDASGNYTIPDLRAGTYTVTLAKAFYLTATATVAITAPVSLSRSLSLDVPASPSTANLTGYWSGTGDYPNAPFKLALIQSGTQLSGSYLDGHDASLSVSGSYSTPGFTLRVDFGDAVLVLDCVAADARKITGVQRTSALGNRPYPFEMTR